MKTSTVALALMAASADALLGLDINLPLGLEVDLDLFGPKTEPCYECIDTWHPPHGVIIDDCDDVGNGDWHWVHPCPETHEPEYTWATSTMTATHVSTIVECPPEVTECPHQSTVYTTVVVPAQTTICPVPVAPTTEVQQPTVVPVVPGPPTAQPPPVVPGQPSSVWVGPQPTLSTSVWVPVPPAPQPTGPVQPPVQPPVVPGVPGVPVPPSNATVPVSIPPVVTMPTPIPTAGAAQNAKNLGLAVAIGAIVAWAL